VPPRDQLRKLDSISEEEMKIYLYFLASDQLQGETSVAWF
jgi:hypothetical protein